jgi:BirA family transcriptional regulator, biotin operon repressor / biotin---[acetyl-CoA-carboxylase] ligase
MDELSRQKLTSFLSATTLVRRLVVKDTVDSTNAEARRFMGRDPAEGLVVIASEQTGGRGRRGRTWVSRHGCGLWMTAVVKPDVPPDELQKCTLLAGLAVCRSIVLLAGGEPRPVIKWPNDVLIKGKKLCGILCETAAGPDEQVVLIGIGVNTKTPAEGWGEADGVAISLEQAFGKTISRMHLAAAILNQLQELLDIWHSAGFPAIAAGYREFMLPPGSAVNVVDGEKRGQGTIERLDDGGGLLVRLASGETNRIISGEISVGGVEGYV